MNQSSPPPPLVNGDFTVENTSFTLSHFISLVAVTCSVVSVFLLVNTIVIKEYLRKRNLVDSNV